MGNAINIHAEIFGYFKVKKVAVPKTSAINAISSPEIKRQAISARVISVNKKRRMPWL